MEKVWINKSDNETNSGRYERNPLMKNNIIGKDIKHEAHVSNNGNA